MSLSNDSSYILSIKGLTVNYGPQFGLKGLSLTVKRGDIHAIVGTHGAGKSTLIKVITGIVPKTEGEIIFNGIPLEKHSPEYALKLGIFAIHQEMSIFPGMSAYKNIFLNREIHRNLFFMDRKVMKAKAYEALKMLSLPINLDTPLMFYNSAQQQMVEIAKLLCFSSKLLLVDEIATRLSPESLEKFHHLLSILRERGTTIIYVTSNMNEITNFASCITVLDDGKNVNTYTVSGASKLQLVKLTYSSLYSRKDLETTNIELFYLKNFYENLLNNLRIPLLVTDTRGKIVIINSQLMQLLNIANTSYIDKSVETLIRVPRQIFVNIEKATKFSFSQNDLTIPVSYDIIVHPLPFYDEDASFMGMMFLFEKKSALQKVVTTEERQKKDSNQQLLKKIAAGIAHEINNPLGIILNYLQLIKAGSSFQQTQDDVKVVEEEVLRIKHILQAHLGVETEDENGRHHILVRKFLREIETLIQPSIHAKSINLEFRIEYEGTIVIDQDLLKQILLNLILNGVEAMPNSGTLTIISRQQKINKIPYCIFEVKDSGIGIKEKDKSHIFEPFYSTKHDRANRGLGLALSRDIVTQLGGFIEVDSHYKNGATFRVYLPNTESSTHL